MGGVVVLRFFRKKREIPKIVLDITNDAYWINFQFYKQVGEEKERLDFPLSEKVLRELSVVEGIHLYHSFELLQEDGQLNEHYQLSIQKWYDWRRLDEASISTEEEFEEWERATLVENLWTSTELEEITGDLKMIGIPIKNPQFQLELYINRKNLAHISEMTLPFLKMDGEMYHVPENMYQLYLAILSDEYEEGYRKIAIVQSLAEKAGITLDSFLQKETYHMVEQYDIVPKMLDNETLKLEIEGATLEETNHLNSMKARSSVENGVERNRYVSTEEVFQDVEKIQEKSIFRGEEIPQLLENPEAFFPDLHQPFDLENFSDRVIGFEKITRPTFTLVGDERIWFDKETGEDLYIDEEELKQDILKQPDQNFVMHKGSWVFVNRMMKEAFGLIPKEERVPTDKYGLEIMSNEEEVNYGFARKDLQTIAKYPLPQNIQATLFPHQEGGYYWLNHLYRKGSSGLLADDMGLGKTLQVITFMQKLFEENRLFPSLIVLPIALIENWQNEIKQFAPELADAIYIHQGSHRLKKLELLKEKKLIFTSYDTLKIDQLVLGQIGFECIVLDEAQYVKSNASNRSRAIRAMQGKFRLAMTGTPVENSLEELWTIMDFVQPGALGSLASFKKKYIKNEDYDGLIEQLAPYYLRRTKSEVMHDQLPKKHILEPYYSTASQTQKELAKTLIYSTKEHGSSMLQTINALRMLYSHPHTINEQISPNEATPKLEKVMDLLKEIANKNEKVLIFTEFRKVQLILKQFITKEFSIHVPVVNGETKNRPEAVKQFNETPGFGVMLLSPKAAGVGLTITGANHVIHYTRWWNPAVENQATDRVYRIGQEKEVFVYQIITTDEETFPQGTVEEIMHQILTDKSNLAENVIIPFDTSSLQQLVGETLEILKKTE